MSPKRNRSKKPAYPARLRERVRRLQRHLADRDADALLVTNPRDIQYLTGFVGDDSWALVRRQQEQIHVLSDFRYHEQIQREAPHVKPVMRKMSLADELKKLARRMKLGRIGLQSDHVTLAQRKTLVKMLGAKRLVEIDDQLIKQRAVKDADEIRSIRRALGIQQEAYRRTLLFIKPGQTEREIAAYLEYQMQHLGAEGSSFPTIVAVDANSSLPHAIPGSRKVKDAGSVLIDWGARAGGYCADLTRVIALGRMRSKIREIYQIVLEAQRLAIEAIAPGIALKEVDAVARRIIKKAGYGKQFGHGLGHGIGLDIHEQPILSHRSKGELEPGHVVTVEPGIYLPGVGGVRIEDDVLVTERGHQILSVLPTELEYAMI